MAYFESFQQFIDTITARLTKPPRGVDGSEGVTSTDVLEALSDAGKRMEDAIEHVDLTNSDVYIQASIEQASQQVTLAAQQATLATQQKQEATQQAGYAAADRLLAQQAKADAETYRQDALTAKQQSEAIATGQGIYAGKWNASTNIPALTTTPLANNHYYEVTVGGTQSITGSSETFNPGDKVRSNGTSWDRIPFKVDPNGALSAKNLNLILGKNLFNPSDPDVVMGSYVVFSSGAVLANATYNTTGYIPVTAGQQYALGYKHQIAWYNASKVYISGSDATDTNPVRTAPAGAAYLRCSVITTAWATFQVEAGTARTAYEKYGYRLDSVESQETYAKRADRSALATLADGLSYAAKVAARHLSYTTGKNLFNSNDPDVVLGSSVKETDGFIQTNATYNATGYIEVTAGQTYTLSYKHIIAWYDGEKRFISSSTQTDSNKTQTAPAGAVYLRCTVVTGSWASFQVEQAATQSSFESFRYYIDKLFGADIWVKRAEKATLADLASNVTSDVRLSARQMQYTFGKNLFNKDSVEVVLGSYVVSTSGNLAVNAGYNATGYIPVTAGQQYALSFKHQIAWYNSSKQYISGSNSTDTNPIQTAPAGATFLRCSVATGSWAAFQVEAGATVTAYESFRLTIDKIDGADIGIKRLDESIVLNGKQIGFTPSKNLFNPADNGVQTGYYILYSSGVPGVNASYNATGFIPVTAGQQYALSYKHQIAWYNALKQYISGSDSSDTNKIQTAPAGAAYLRCTVAVGSWATFQVEAGATVTAYEPFSWYLDTINGLKVYAKNVASGSTSPTTGVTYPVIAPKIYVPRKKELSIYTENLYRYFETDGKGKTDIALPAITSTELTIRGRGIKYKQASGNASLAAIAGSVKTYSNDYDLLNTLNFTVQPVDETLTTAKKVWLFGDSYTRRGSKANILVGSPAAAGISFIGMRTASDSTAAAAGVKTEGRGGWAFSTYFTASTTLFNPFMQPQDPYRYFGNTSYWITAISDPNDYDAGLVDPAIRALYNATTGFLNAPATNDVMYDNTAAAYKRWDGSAWVAVTGLTWTFNIAKYRSLYGFPVIDIAHSMLGTNDFASANPSTFTANYPTYKTRYDTLIASLKADNPSVKTLVGIPVSSGKQGRDGTWETERRKVAYWLLAKNLIADYGNREGENIYLVDYHSTVDRVYGYDPLQVLPFDQYSGVERDLYSSDYVHISADGFKQMGDVFYGAVQALR